MRQPHCLLNPAPEDSAAVQSILFQALQVGLVLELGVGRALWLLVFSLRPLVQVAAMELLVGMADRLMAIRHCSLSLVAQVEVQPPILSTEVSTVAVVEVVLY